MNLVEFTTTRGLWIAVIAIEVAAVLYRLFFPLSVEKWPYFEGKFESAGQYQAVKLAGHLLYWLLGTPQLVARVLVGIAILRFLGWVR